MSKKVSKAKEAKAEVTSQDLAEAGFDVPQEEKVEVKKDARAEKAQDRPLKDSEYDLVEVDIPVPVKINGVVLQRGKHVVPRHQSRDIVAICSKKMAADLQALAVDSKSYLVNRALDGSINVKQVSEIKLK